MTTRSRLFAVGISVGLIAGLIAGASVVLAQGPAATDGPAATLASLPRVGAVTPAGGSASGSAASGAVIAYPYPIIAGTPGIAPDHTIVVTGTGSGNMASDGSDRATAEKTALTAALADAKAQATIIATTIGVSIKGVVSVSASVGSYGPIPLTGGATGGAPTEPLPAPNLPQPAWPAQLTVSVTVVYAIA